MQKEIFCRPGDSVPQICQTLHIKKHIIVTRNFKKFTLLYNKFNKKDTANSTVRHQMKVLVLRRIHRKIKIGQRKNRIFTEKMKTGSRLAINSTSNFCFKKLKFKRVFFKPKFYVMLKFSKPTPNFHILFRYFLGKFF